MVLVPLIDLKAGENNSQLSISTLVYLQSQQVSEDKDVICICYKIKCLITSNMLFVLRCYCLFITCNKVTSSNPEVQSHVSKSEEIVKDADIFGNLEHHPSRYCPTCKEPMLFICYQCKNKY